MQPKSRHCPCVNSPGWASAGICASGIRSGPARIPHRKVALSAYYMLYVMLDIYSRYVVGWLLAERENAKLAQHLLRETMAKHGIKPGQLTVHQDRGSPMRRLCSDDPACMD